MTYPTPSGAPPITTGMTSYTEAYFQGLFTKQWGAKAGSAYATYNKNHPGNSAYTNANQFVELVLVEGLDTAIQTAVTAGTAADTGTVSGAAKGGEIAVNDLTNPLKWALSFGNTTGLLTRILKVVFGGVLIIAGVMKMTGAKQDILTVAKGAALA
jgi:hypothetical protein